MKMVSKKEIKNEVIDFEKKGNLIRFYLGENGKQWGDDWDDAPYEHNAERVYDEFVKGYCDIVFDFDCEVDELNESLEVANTIYCKDDMRKRAIYYMKIKKIGDYEERLFYFGDKIEDILKLRPCHLVHLVYKGGKNENLQRKKIKSR